MNMKMLELKQGRCSSALAYLERFHNQVEVIEESSGSIGFYESMLETELGLLDLI